LYENAYANASGWNISQANLQHRKIDKAHARIQESFNRGVLTLISFLNSIDESKFRPG
jgi:hypothetical protein